MPSSTAINASDFSDKTTDVNRYRWTLGKMRFAINALGDTPVAIVVEKRTGFTILNATLVETYHGGPGIGSRVRVRHDSENTVNYYLPEVGNTIIPLAEDITAQPAKYQALESWRRFRSEMIAKAQAAHGECENRTWGAWSVDVDTAVPGVGANVRYEPSTGNPAFADKWGTSWGGWVTA